MAAIEVMASLWEYEDKSTGKTVVSSVDAEVSLTDCTRKVTLDFDVALDREVDEFSRSAEERLEKLDLIVTELCNLRAWMVEQIDKHS